MARMRTTGRRNKLEEDDYVPEYLIYGRFHTPPCPKEGEDTLGYVSKRWTSLLALEELRAADAALALPVAKFLSCAKESHAAFIESVPEPVPYAPGTQTQQSELSDEAV